MKPTKIKIRGITSAYPGDLDLDLTEAAGLVALIGPNGAGKTTLLEALGPLTLYGSSPSRGCGVPRLAVSTEAVIDLEGEHAGQAWRIRREINPDKGQHDGYLWIDGADQNTGGKVTSLDEEIRRRYLPESLYLASVFASQHGRGSFVGLKEAERRDLFAALLGIEQLQALSEQARDVAADAAGAVEECDRLLVELRASDARRVELEARHGALAGPLDEAERVAADREGIARDLRGALDGRARTATADRQRRETLTTKRATAAARIVELDAEVARLATSIAEAEAASAGLPAQEARLSAMQIEAERASTARAALDSARSSAARAEAAERTARRALADAQAAVVAVVDAEAAWQAAGPKREQLAHLRERRAGLEAEVARLEAEVARLETEGATKRAAAERADRDHKARLLELSGKIAAGERGRERLASTPCQGRTLLSDGPETGFEGPVECHRCPMISDAREAAEGLDQAIADRAREVEVGGEAVTEAARILSEARADYSHAAEQLRALRGQVDRVREQHGSLELELARIARPPAAELERRRGLEQEAVVALGEAEEHHRGARAEVADLEARPVAGPTPMEVQVVRGQVDRLRILAGELLARRERQAGRQAEADRLRLEVEDLDGQIAAVPAAEDLTELQARVAASEEAARTARDTARGLAAERAGVGGQLAELEGVSGRLARVTAIREDLARTAGAYRLLELGLGRKGVQAHEIDGAGPTVSDLVNDLLGSCYGDRFRVELVTQQEASRNRKAKEVFELRIHDAERGDSRAFDSLSGGEQVVIDEAIKLALALLTTRRSGIRCRWLFRDEVDGKLDDANARRYPPMLRRAMEIGGFEAVAFVSHRPEVFEQADVVIRVTGGKATIEGLS